MTTSNTVVLRTLDAILTVPTAALHLSIRRSPSDDPQGATHTVTATVPLIGTPGSREQPVYAGALHECRLVLLEAARELAFASGEVREELVLLDFVGLAAQALQPPQEAEEEPEATEEGEELEGDT